MLGLAQARAEVILIHSSVAGSGQWRGVQKELATDFHLHTPDLIGYGENPGWQSAKRQTLRDQAGRLADLLPADGARVSIVGHSFGGSVAMEFAALFRSRVDRLVLIEPNPFAILTPSDHPDARAEIEKLRTCIKENGAAGDWHIAARTFADYWTGEGSWDAMPKARQDKFASTLQPNFHEWDAVTNDPHSAQDWAARLPKDTSLIWSADTVRSIRDIISVLSAACPEWRRFTLPHGGHMAALSRPIEMAQLVRQALMPDQNPL